MRTSIQTLLILLLFAIPICFAQTSVPSSIPMFSDYRASQVYKGQNATPKISPDWRDMRTLIREESRKPPNFAGSYRFVSWGCGTDCARSLVINLRTGDVYDPPYGTFSKDWYPKWSGKGFEFHVNSRLLVADGCFEKCGIHYYEWTGDDFQLIQTVTERQVAHLPASTQAQTRDTAGSQPAVINGPGFVGVIFPANTKTTEVDHYLYPKGASFWTPAESDIFSAEKALTPFLKQSHNPKTPEILKKLDTYKRQYRGVVLHGHKQIFIRFFCEISSDSWMTEEAIIVDGGSCFFNLQYSPETKTFSHFWVNGQA
jgi:hypothetical protein